jgi:hypothetical protein
MGQVFVLYVYRFWFEWDRGGAMSGFLSLESSRGKLDTVVEGVKLGVYSFSRWQVLLTTETLTPVSLLRAPQNNINVT